MSGFWLGSSHCVFQRDVNALAPRDHATDFGVNLLLKLRIAFPASSRLFPCPCQLELRWSELSPHFLAPTLRQARSWCPPTAFVSVDVREGTVICGDTENQKYIEYNLFISESSDLDLIDQSVRCPPAVVSGTLASLISPHVDDRPTTGSDLGDQVSKWRYDCQQRDII
jgi:hypothetical protein